jgi:hypothetical protein
MRRSHQQGAGLTDKSEQKRTELQTDKTKTAKPKESKRTVNLYYAPA